MGDDQDQKRTDVVRGILVRDFGRSFLGPQVVYSSAQANDCNTYPLVAKTSDKLLPGI